jgi:hypothetical protein
VVGWTGWIGVHVRRHPCPPFALCACVRHLVQLERAELHGGRGGTSGGVVHGGVGVGSGGGRDSPVTVVVARRIVLREFQRRDRLLFVLYDVHGHLVAYLVRILDAYARIP